jgi:hypothetical protein
MILREHRLRVALETLGKEGENKLLILLIAFIKSVNNVRLELGRVQYKQNSTQTPWSGTT